MGLVGIFALVVVVPIMIVGVGVRIRVGMTMRMGGGANWDRDDSLIRHAAAFSFRKHRQPLQNTREQRVHS